MDFWAVPRVAAPMSWDKPMRPRRPSEDTKSCWGQTFTWTRKGENTTNVRNSRSEDGMSYRVRGLGAWSKNLCERAVTVVSLTSNERQGRERYKGDPSVDDIEKLEAKISPFRNFWRRGLVEGANTQVVILKSILLQDFTMNVIIERGTAKTLPSFQVAS